MMEGQYLSNLSQSPFHNQNSHINFLFPDASIPRVELSGQSPFEASQSQSKQGSQGSQQAHQFTRSLSNSFGFNNRELGQQEQSIGIYIDGPEDDSEVRREEMGEAMVGTIVASSVIE